MINLVFIPPYEAMNTVPGKKLAVPTLVPTAAFLYGFGRHLFTDGVPGLLPLIFSGLIFLLLIVCWIRLVPELYRFQAKGYLPDVYASGSSRALRTKRAHPVVRILLFALISRLLLYALFYVFHLAKYGYDGGFFDYLPTLCARFFGFDAAFFEQPVKEIFAAATPVSMPLYPAVVHLFSSSAGNTLGAAILISNICFVLASVPVYELSFPDEGRSGGWRSVRYLCLLPASLLFLFPTEASMLLLFSSLALLFMRKRRPVLTALFGVLAVLTHGAGVLLVLPLLVEALYACLDPRRKTSFFFAFLYQFFPAFLFVAAFLFVLLPANGFSAVPWGSLAETTAARFLLLNESGFRVPVLVLCLAAFGMLCCCVLLNIAVSRVRVSYLLYGLGCAFFLLSVCPAGALPVCWLSVAAVPCAVSAITRNEVADVCLSWFCLTALLVLVYMISAGVLPA